MTIWRRVLLGMLSVCVAARAGAQDTPPEDTRTQWPAAFVNSYFGLNVGSIRYLFRAPLEPGFQAESVHTPHLGVRVDLFGHYFNEHLSLTATYIRPGQFIYYENVNGDGERHGLSTAYGGVTLGWTFPLNDRVSAYVEGGGGVTSRAELSIRTKTALARAHYTAGLLGAGLAYHLSPRYDVMMGATYSPGRESFNQPSTRLFTMGLRYRIRQVPDAVARENREAGFVFPANIMRLGYTSNLLGYGANTMFSRWIPVFWNGNAETRRGFTLDYQRNIFHTKERFAFDLGGSASYFNGNNNKEIFRTLSAYPLFRFFLKRTQPADIYFVYSLAGPTYITRSIVDGQELGEIFTFQDFMGVGGYLGRSRHLNAELGIKHFSNGNLFTTNGGVKVPLTLTLGWAF